DHVLAMDSDNFEILMQACPEQFKNKIKYFLDFAPHLDTREVPDPYYGGNYGFERVLDMVEDASIGFLDSLRQSGEVH
ncbi:MAG: low molecular weight phosphotyrosine protein phosphatase, partial [Methylococcales bacterium]